MSQHYAYQNPILSLWQASVAEVHRRRASVHARMNSATATRLVTPPLAIQDDLMTPAHDLANALIAGQQPDKLFASEASGSSGVAARAVVVDCAKSAAKFLWAEIKGDKADSEKYAGELKFSECDAVGWSECLTTYLAYKASLGTLPYRQNQNVVIDLDSSTKLAIIGDWGTGDSVAINLLQQVAALKPDVLIHLGDVYYAGTTSECHANFYDVCREILGNSFPLYSLCGNHDMYSGGTGYYWLVDQISQKSSYFCLQNDNWQFLAMDTGHNDNDPFTVNTNMTSLVVDPNTGWAESDWLLDKINTAVGQRRTVLLSHHQLFSPFGSVGTKNKQPYAYNPNLFENFQAVMPEIDWWFWGHEHTLAVYSEYMNLKRGRCVGASAVPVYADQQQYKSADGLQKYGNNTLPTWNPNGIVSNDGSVYSNCFAIMTLNGNKANVDYYDVPIGKTATKLNVVDEG